MTFFGALGTAVQGINAQATAIGHISDNVANATTIGYKQVNTIFADLVTNKVLGDSKDIDSNRHMGVGASADFGNRRQGTINRDSSTTSIAISGNGYFPVSKATGINSATGQPSGFDDTTYYTRLGDFRAENSNRLVNSAGFYLQGVALAPGQTAAAAGAVPTDFVIDTTDIDPVPTSQVFSQINLPASALPGKQITTGIGVVDANSEEQNFQVVWTKTATDTWDITINTSLATPSSFGPVTATFTNGTLTTLTSADTNVAVTAAGQATLSVSVDYGAGAQAIVLDIGAFGGTFDVTANSGTTQYAGEDREASNISLSQNGLLGGEFQYVSFEEDGQIIYNYTNGRNRTGGQVMLANFAEPDQLDRLDGTTFIANSISGDVFFGQPRDPNSDTGVGNLVPGSLEQSTVDVADQMTKLIVAQQAYSMNGQVISAADSMLSRLIDMKR
ncbi:MAG: flagellar hook-basal body complex protein [Ferrovibrio sp.]|uniref:flagellar hook protein FlgE n=1 Tax=Ferrovibrio sp. TaxID=1917215 RepID=UPI00261FEFE2|nr:flagellar hook-basal body complex protein [Ferrovibrio sp.]MCW0233140.1 flagellar hook-basal body complex protein [Ferrovibrio sp.]